MKKIYFVVCGRYMKFKNPKISYSLEKKLDLSIICSKRGSKDEKIFKEGKSVEILKILDLIKNIERYQKIWLKKA